MSSPLACIWRRAAPTAADAANTYLDTALSGASRDCASIEVGDFFETEGPGSFTLGYDCTFLCAIPPEVSWARPPSTVPPSFLGRPPLCTATRHGLPTRLTSTDHCRSTTTGPATRQSRARWAAKWAELLADDGELVTLIFPVKPGGADPADTPLEGPGGGPPYEMSPRLVKLRK